MSNLKGHRLEGRRFSLRAIMETLKIVRELDVTMNDTLPQSMTRRGRRALVRSGVVFGVPANKNDLFVPVRLPNGWTKASTENPSITNLVDKNSHVRATLFAETHSAHTEVHQRYSVSWIESEADGITTYIGTVTDNASGQIVHRTLPETTDDPAGSISEGPYSDNRDMGIFAAMNAAEAWLDDEENYPHWRDAAQYWGS